MGATKIMVIRHAEKPGRYNGVDYQGVLATGQENEESLVTLGWERAGGLVTLFAPPWGPGGLHLAIPDAVFAADPADKDDPRAGRHASDNQPSQRPYQTVSAVASLLGLNIDASYRKSKFKAMADAALTSDGVVLIAWQHQDILEIGRHILTHTDTHPDRFTLPDKWPGDRYDLVWVFHRPDGSGPIASFTQVPQMLLAGDQNTVIPSSGR